MVIHASDSVFGGSNPSSPATPEAFGFRGFSFVFKGETTFLIGKNVSLFRTLKTYLGLIIFLKTLRNTLMK